jgi:sigma-B regulation protein RsbU (phosphoserine phosphatase)
MATASKRARAIIETYTQDLRGRDLGRLFTHDTPDAYNFFRRGIGEDAFASLPWWKRMPLRFRQVFVAFTLKLSPARRALYIGALAIAVIGLIQLFRGLALTSVPFGIPFLQIELPLPSWAEGTLALLVSFLLLNLLVLLEVADRLSLKGELEVAREIQLAMLPRGTWASADVEIAGQTRPANTVGGDFYDVLALDDGKVIVTLGDVAGKGSPAALLMALLLAVLRTLVDERLSPSVLVDRLNVQICRHSPASRFITFFYGVYDLATGTLSYVNAGQNPPLIRRYNGTYDRLGPTGVALGMFDHSTFEQASTTIRPGDVLVLYSDGITEAEDSAGRPLEESGLELALERHAWASAADLGARVISEVERHAGQPRFHDDLTILVLKRAAGPTV